MFRLYNISIVDSRTDRLQYFKFKFLVPLLFDKFEQITEIRIQLNLMCNPNNISVYEYIQYALQNKPYNEHQCEPTIIKCNDVNDIINYLKKMGT